jgi:phage-related minor tail protein
MKLNNSPIDKFTYHGREFLVKRDDLLDKTLNYENRKKRKSTSAIIFYLFQ